MYINVNWDKTFCGIGEMIHYSVNNNEVTYIYYTINIFRISIYSFNSQRVKIQYPHFNIFYFRDVLPVSLFPVLLLVSLLGSSAFI